ncbi:unnamed protein product [Tetraodon nigroviridis]|uniref:(spotted green pufferfish) hypothetical protein n=1 Tax=Tetraodon nigroviridis TaxID=99883 RepID=Q4RIP4_TETNG|nr:unnamed protein product [Tetraodon nigroviridis]
MDGRTRSAALACRPKDTRLVPPKPDLIHCTNELNVSIPHLADTLLERTASSSWIVVFKALITTHHLMMYGNERLMQYLASRNALFNLNNFLDKAALQGYKMSTFIRRYSRYLNEKAVSYRIAAVDFTKMKRGADGVMRTMNTEKLIKTLPTIQNQLDALLDFQPNSNELTNGVINTAFMLLFKDSIRLFAAYNEGVINMLEKYFDMKKNQCKEALEIYKTFLNRMTKLSEFLKVAERVGIDQGDSPDLTQAPSSLLEALEQHLASLEGRKMKDLSIASRSSTLSSAVSSLSSTGISLSCMEDKAEDNRLQQHKAGAPVESAGGEEADGRRRLAVEDHVHQHQLEPRHPSHGTCAHACPSDEWDDLHWLRSGTSGFSYDNTPSACVRNAPSSNESSNGGRSHDAPPACYVQPASPETHQPLRAHPRDTGTTSPSAGSR